MASVVQFFEKIANFIFPRFCFVCAQEGDWLCAKCITPLVTVAPGSEALGGVISIFHYRESPGIAQFIQALKYRRAFDLASALPIIFGAVHTTDFLAVQRAVVMPVPLHPCRERERGFNQSFFIARACAQFLSASLVTDNLVRTKYTSQQATLGKAKRHQNMVDAFAYVGESPPVVLLVDDVFTTGATMQACAQALKTAGAKAVWGLALARD